MFPLRTTPKTILHEEGDLSTQHGVTHKLSRSIWPFADAVKLAKCDLRVVSFYDPYGQKLNSPWRVKHRILDVGTQDCLIQSEKLNLTTPVTIKPGDIFERESITESMPQLVDVEISVGATGISLTKTTVPLYIAR